jgi:hypothetical protein
MSAADWDLGRDEMGSELHPLRRHPLSDIDSIPQNYYHVSMRSAMEGASPIMEKSLTSVTLCRFFPVVSFFFLLIVIVVGGQGVGWGNYVGPRLRHSRLDNYTTDMSTISKIRQVGCCRKNPFRRPRQQRSDFI